MSGESRARRWMLFVIAGASWAGAGCGGSATVMDMLVELGAGADLADLKGQPGAESTPFPSGFLFGTAIAGFQVEMGCPTITAGRCEDPNSDWYQFITDPSLVADKGLYLSGDPPRVGPGFYELYAQDLDRASHELSGNTLRLSLEWSRIFPTATDGIDGYDALKKVASADGLAFYHAVFSAMKTRGLKPFVTLNHYALPTWIHDTVACHEDLDTCKNKGWVDQARIEKEIAKYAGFVGREFGADVDLWATLNEPFTAVVLAGFLLPTAARTNPPGVSLKTDAAKTAMVSMIEAHAKMYDAVHAADTVDADSDGKAASVGIVYNLQAATPDDPTNENDVQGAKNLSYLMNEVFLNGVGKGDLDANLDGTIVHRADLAGRLDFLGVNYYDRVTVQGTAKSTLPAVSSLLTFNPLTITLTADPSGIYEVMQFARRFGVPIYLTETGIDLAANPDAGDPWIVQTLGWLRRAMADGVDVRGYYYWSLMDNYEWNHGMSMKLGLYAVDPGVSKTRTARSEVALYAGIASSRTLSPALLAKYPLQ